MRSAITSSILPSERLSCTIDQKSGFESLLLYRESGTVSKKRECPYPPAPPSVSTVIAQSVERYLYMVDVLGSSPSDRIAPRPCGAILSNRDGKGFVRGQLDDK